MDKLEPLHHCSADLSGVLKYAAKIDVTWIKIRLQPDTFLESIYGACPIADISKCDAKIKIRSMQKTVARIVRNPSLV